jgi:hypothetical protein
MVQELPFLQDYEFAGWNDDAVAEQNVTRCGCGAPRGYGEQ